MKPFLLLLALTLAGNAAAQTTTIPARTGSAAPAPGVFSIAPRYSNHSTDVDMGLATIETGRQHSLGFIGGYRAGSFVLDFMVDHDPENGFSIIEILPFDFGDYSRDRGEVTVGWAALPFLDLQGGVRLDSVTVGSSDDFLFSGTSFEHQALVLGASVHSAPGSRVVVYGTARGLIGTADFEDFDLAGDVESDTTGWRAEAGVVIPVGQSNWSVAPGFEIERLETDRNILTLESNRFLLNVIYTFR